MYEERWTERTPDGFEFDIYWYNHERYLLTDHPLVRDLVNQLCPGTQMGIGYGMSFGFNLTNSQPDIEDVTNILTGQNL